MRWVNKLRLRVRSLFHRSQVEQELDAELHFHLEQQTEENLPAGMSQEEARYAARKTFGNVCRPLKTRKSAARGRLCKAWSQGFCP